MNIKVFRDLFLKIDSQSLILDHIIICIYDLLKKHINILISTDEKFDGYYKDIQNLIFQCINKRYLGIENPSNIIRNIICGCVSILIISGITQSWENCIEDLIQNTFNNENKKEELIFITLKSIADCDSIMNFMKDDDNDNYWDDTLNFTRQKKIEIRNKLISKSGIILDFANKVYMNINTFEKDIRTRIIQAIIDLITFLVQLELKILTNNDISKLLMELINQSIIMNNNEKKEENIKILKNISEGISKLMNSSDNIRLYEFSNKIEDGESVEIILKNIANNTNLTEKPEIEKWLNFVLEKLEQYNNSKNNNKEILWALSKIFSSILENFIFFFFDLNNPRNVMMFNWFSCLISEKRIISWMFFNTIENMMTFIVDYFRFYTYTNQQKRIFAELLISILIGIMNNCSYHNLDVNDFSQLQKDILFINNEFNWNTENINYSINDDMDDVNISEYRNSAEFTLFSIYLIFKSGFNSPESEIILFNKIFSLMTTNNNINNCNTINDSQNLIKLDIILFALKSMIKGLNNESSPNIFAMINNFLYNLQNSEYIQNNKIFVDYLLLINQYPSFLIQDEKLFKNVIYILLSVTQNFNNNQLLLDSCYVIMGNLCREFKSNIVYEEYFKAFFERYKILCDNFSLDNTSQIENLIKVMFYSLGVNGDNYDKNENKEINNEYSNIVIVLIEEILKPLSFNVLMEKNRELLVLKQCLIKSFYLYKEIFYHIFLCNKYIKQKILKYFVSNTTKDFIESNQKLESQNNKNIKIFNLFPNDEELVNPLVDLYLSLSYNIVENNYELIPGINEAFIQIIKLGNNNFRIIDFFGFFYKYVLEFTKKENNNYIEINKYILDNFLQIINTSINYINVTEKNNNEEINKINLFLSTIINVFPNIYISENDKDIVRDINRMIQYIKSITYQIRKEGFNDRLITNIIKSLSSILNNNIIGIKLPFPEKDQITIVENVVDLSYILLNIKNFGCLSIQELPLLYYQTISLNMNLFTSVFLQKIISMQIFNDIYINNIRNYIRKYYEMKDNIIEFFRNIIEIIKNQKQIDSLEFYFNRLNTKKS